MSLIITGTGPVLVTESPSEYLWTPQGSGGAPVPPLLQATSIVVLDSVKSGNRVPTKDVYKQLLLPLLDSWNLSHRYVATTSPETIREVAASVSGAPTLLVLISGDTTITELVNSVARNATVTLLTVPMGTGNAFAHSIGLSTPLAAVHALTTGTTRALRLYEAVFEQGSQLLAQGGAQPVSSVRFLVVGSWGLHACLVADSDSPELRKLGNERFKVAARRVLEQNPVFHGSFRADGLAVENHAALSYFVVAAVPRFEATFEISPASDPAENALHVVYFHHQPPATVMEIMGQAYNAGKHVQDPRVGYLKARTVELEIHEQDARLRRICVDGLIVQPAGSSVLFRSVESTNLQYISPNKN
ncbi:hypothetical protein KL923_002423 [Ogataea haglerorum]|nr:hypothetical protein KL923_002423 [Ogataea haglerorum]KAG7802550.1 hypothetical protein KL944_002197 [Ogataea haglerorum]